MLNNPKVDLYQTVAQKMFNLEYEDITKEQRYIAKICLLGIMYGMVTKIFYLIIKFLLNACNASSGYTLCFSSNEIK